MGLPLLSPIASRGEVWAPVGLPAGRPVCRFPRADGPRGRVVPTGGWAGDRPARWLQSPLGRTLEARGERHKEVQQAPGTKTSQTISDRRDRIAPKSCKKYFIVLSPGPLGGENGFTVLPPGPLGGENGFTVLPPGPEGGENDFTVLPPASEGGKMTSQFCLRGLWVAKITHSFASGAFG